MKRILVIDDDEIVNDMLVQFLTEAGYEVEGVRDGVQGVQAAETKLFDLIVSDIVMPEKEGLETIIEIRGKKKNLPVIVISGGGKVTADEYLNLAKVFGADYTFKKPIELDQFLEAVRHCLSDTYQVDLSKTRPHDLSH